MRTFRNFNWFPLIVVLIAIAGAAGLVYVIARTTADYRNQCHDAGGHIVEVSGSHVCVDHDNRIILV